MLMLCHLPSGVRLAASSTLHHIDLALLPRQIWDYRSSDPAGRAFAPEP